MQIFLWDSKRLTFCLILSTLHLINGGFINTDEHKSENFYGFTPSGLKESLSALEEILFQDWLKTSNSDWIIPLSEMKHPNVDSTVSFNQVMQLKVYIQI